MCKKIQFFKFFAIKIVLSVFWQKKGLGPLGVKYSNEPLGSRMEHTTIFLLGFFLDTRKTFT